MSMRHLDRRLRKVEAAVARLDPDSERPLCGPVQPRPGAILDNVATALAHESSRLAELAKRRPLSKADRRALTDFIRALAVISAEDERMRKADAVASLSDDQLRELAAKLLAQG